VTLTAIYARRDEPDELVDGLRENLAWVDHVVEVRVPREGGWGHEGQLMARKRALLEQHRAEWVLFVDPDERIEDRAAELIPPLLAQAPQSAIFMFPFREMWTPTHYRCDGAWGRKGARKRLFHLHPGQTFLNKRIHCQPIPIMPRSVRQLLPTYMYHLKLIEPGNRVERARAYLDADPTGRWLNGGDWSIFYDETGLQLAEPEHPFTPPYRAGSYVFTAPGR